MALAPQLLCMAFNYQGPSGLWESATVVHSLMHVLIAWWQLSVSPHLWGYRGLLTAS